MGRHIRFLLLVISLFAQALAEERSAEIIELVTNRKTIALTPYVDVLPQANKIETFAKKNGFYVPVPITVGMYQTTQKFHRDLPPTTIFAYGRNATTATFPGPTIEALRYYPSYITFKNYLPATHILPVDDTIAAAMAPHGGVPAVVHLHGGVVSPENDGSAFAWYTANYTDVGSAFTRETYYYPNIQHPGNLMYHDHALGLTRINLLAGLLGAYIIRELSDGTSPLSNLPKGEEYDRHLVIADRSFNSDGSIYMNSTGVDPAVHPSWRPEYFGDSMTVNGKIWPYLNVQRRKYRFRIINACNARYLRLRLYSSDSKYMYPFYVIGSDSSYLSAPVKTYDIVVAVAEIFDVVVDFTGIPYSEVYLINTAKYPYPDGAVPDIRVMKFALSYFPTYDPSVIPPTLITNYDPARPSDAVATRYMALYEYFDDTTGQTTHMYINGKKLTDPVTETPKSGTTELWNVINLTGDDHPLHLHLAHIQAIKMQEVTDLENFKTCMQINQDALLCNITGLATGNVTAVPAYEKTWKNVVKLPPGVMTTVVVKFKLVDSNLSYPFDPSASPGYVYHCHILDHEDNEMIRPLQILQ